MSQSQLTADEIRTQTSQILGQALTLILLLGLILLSSCTSGLTTTLKIQALFVSASVILLLLLNLELYVNPQGSVGVFA